MKTITRNKLAAIVGTTAFVICVAGCSAKNVKTSSSADGFGSALALGQAGMPAYADKEPGETKPLDRAYEIAPPLVPHTAQLEIRRSINECVDCHAAEDEVADGHIATKIPDSHYTNPFTGQKLANDGDPIGMRLNCLQCHVPQATAQPPVKVIR